MELHDAGDGALLVAYSGSSPSEANARAIAHAQALLAAELPGVLEVIPGAQTLLVLFDPTRCTVKELARQLDAAPTTTTLTASRVELPVLYDGADLGPVASEVGMTVDELVRLHGSLEHRVAFTGFAPGFAYMEGLPDKLRVPRLTTPRPRVPAGSVAIADRYTGIYPAEMPGGWRLLGRCPVRLFDAARTPPSLLTAGVQVRFVAVDEVEFARLASAESVSPPAPGAPVLKVVSPGPFTTVQGAPRHGQGRYGVPSGGAIDPVALAIANRAVGNPPHAAGLEVTLKGPELELLDDTHVSVLGAEATLEGEPLALGKPRAGRAGQRLRVGKTTPGVRGYVAVRGGLAPREGALRAGETLGSARLPALAIEEGAAPEALIEPTVLRAIALRSRGWFSEAATQQLFSTAYRVSPQSDRRGVRLSGPSLSHVGAPEIPPEGAPRGTIQVPGDGQPIIVGPDGPVTGGYPKIATVIRADLPLVGRLRPGAMIRFEEVTVEEAIRASAGGAR